ncbi:hypothetical protein ACSNOF_17170, partial [Streptomyces sp. URMC 125]
MTGVPVRGAEAAALVTRRQKQRAVEHWLLSTTADPQAARSQWRESGLALLPCGSIFAAVRMPGDVVRAAAGTSRTGEVDAFLREALDGPVFVDCYSQQAARADARCIPSRPRRARHRIEEAR